MGIRPWWAWHHDLFGLSCACVTRYIIRLKSCMVLKNCHNEYLTSHHFIFTTWFFFFFFWMSFISISGEGHWLDLLVGIYYIDIIIPIWSMYLIMFPWMNQAIWYSFLWGGEKWKIATSSLFFQLTLALRTTLSIYNP